MLVKFASQFCTCGNQIGCNGLVTCSRGNKQFESVFHNTGIFESDLTVVECNEQDPFLEAD